MPFFSVAILILVIATTYFRLHFGIDFTDESYYIVMPLRFARGDHPFVDELFINQTAALITLPLIKFFYSLSHNTEGIVLFVRTSFLIFSTLVGVLVIRYFKTHTSLTLAILVGAAQIAIIPLNIPGLSYNSIGALCFTAMIFAKNPLVSALLGGLAGVAYPTLILPCLLFQSLSLGLANRGRKLKSFLMVCTGFLLVLFAFAPYFINAGSSLADSIVYSLTSFDHGGGFAKLKLVLSHIFYANVPLTLLLSFLMAAVSVTPQINPFLRLALLLILPVTIFQIFSSAMYTQIWFVFYFSFLGPILSLGSEARLDTKRLLLHRWVPSMLAGICISWTSSSSAINGVLGLTPAFLISLYLLIERAKIIDFPRWSQAVPALITIAILLFTQFSGKAFYRDQDFTNLKVKIQNGPFRGLYTSTEKFRYLAQITSDIKRLENKTGKILFYEFPAGYLISNMRPAVNSTWIRDISRGKDYYARYYQRQWDPHNIVFEVDWLCHEKSNMQRVRYPDSDPLNKLIKNTHEIVLSRPEYRVFEPKG